MLLPLLVWSVPVIAILVGAAFVVPPSVPILLRQVVLCVIGVGGITVAERRLFGYGGLQQNLWVASGSGS
jgi:hypothetical protein